MLCAPFGLGRSVGLERGTSVFVAGSLKIHQPIQGRKKFLRTTGSRRSKYVVTSRDGAGPWTIGASREKLP